MSRESIVRVTDRLQLLGLALMIGGMLVLGALVAPALFRHFSPVSAGAVATALFRRYDMVLLGAAGLVVLGEGMRIRAFGISTSLWSRLRYGIVVMMASITLYASVSLHPQIEAYQAAGIHRGVGVEGERFEQAHHQSEMLYKTGLLLAVLTLLLFPLPRRGY